MLVDCCLFFALLSSFSSYVKWRHLLSFPYVKLLMLFFLWSFLSLEPCCKTTQHCFCHPPNAMLFHVSLVGQYPHAHTHFTLFQVTCGTGWQFVPMFFFFTYLCLAAFSLCDNVFALVTIRTMLKYILVTSTTFLEITINKILLIDFYWHDTDRLK